MSDENELAGSEEELEILDLDKFSYQEMQRLGQSLLSNDVSVAQDVFEEKTARGEEFSTTVKKSDSIMR